MKNSFRAHALILATTFAIASGCAPLPGRSIAHQPDLTAMTVDEIQIDPEPGAFVGQETGHLRIKVQWPESGRQTQAFPATTSQFRLTVTSSDIPQPIAATITRTNGSESEALRLTVPAGINRTLRVEGLNGAGKVVASATVTGLTVTAGEYTPVTAGLTTLVGIVSGTIVNSETGAPIPGASVTLNGAIVMSDASGSFAFQDVTPGGTTLAISTPYFSDVSKTLTIQANVATNLSKVELVPKHWYPKMSGTQAYLLGVFAISDQEAWACGSGGTLLHTVDGGEIWRRVSVPANSSDLHDVQFASKTVGYALSSSNGLLRTDDGGATWAIANSQMKGTCLVVTSVNDVYVGGTDLLITDNGGVSFRTMDFPAYRLEALSVVSPEIYFAGYNGGAWKTTSGGISWSTTGVGTYTSGYDYLIADSVNHCIAVGYSSDKPRIFESNDGGVFWNSVYSSNEGGSLYSISRVGSGYCAVGNDGTIIMKMPGSSTWTAAPIHTGADPDWLFDLKAVHFASNTVGWAVGDNGKILKY